MKIKTQYFILPGRFGFKSAFLIKFDGQYSYWGNLSGKWIHDPTLVKQNWIEDYFTPITEKEAKKIIKEEEEFYVPYNRKKYIDISSD